MRSFRFSPSRAAILALTLALVGSPGHAMGQELRDVISKEVSVGRDAAVLRLELTGGLELELALREGQVGIDDSRLGSYEPGGALDIAWRELLGTAVTLENGPLARALVAWEPPEGLLAEGERVAAALDRALEEALTAPADQPSSDEVDPVAPEVRTDLTAALALLTRTDRLVDLAEALEDLEMDALRLVVDEDLVVDADDVIEGSLLVVDGDLEVAGLIRGDVVMVGGDVVLAEGGRITGELRHSDGSVVRRGGEVDGDIRRIEPVSASIDRQVEERVRDEVRRAVRDQNRRSSWSPLRRIGDGLGGAFGNLFTVLVLGIAGGVVLYFGGANVDAIAETARRTPGRAALVGTAGAFLALPAWILGMIALAISIIGIPVLILWVPLFPVAVVMAAGMGYLAVARNLGSWVAGQRYPFFEWVRIQNPYSLVFGGLLLLSMAFIAANLISIVPFLGVLEGLLIAAGVAATVFAVLVGFGAFILTRGGRRPEFWGEEMFTSSGTATGWDDLDPTGMDEPDEGPDLGTDGPTSGGAGPDDDDDGGPVGAGV